MNDLTPNDVNNMTWRSFCANYVDSSIWKSNVYNDHGHVGFAWGAKREVLEVVPLYDRALIGGADHIIARAATGQIGHNCIIKSFTDNLEEVNQWSKEFYEVVNGKIGYVKGNLYHIWHGDIDNRQYFKRIKDFTSKAKEIVHRDKNGLFITNKENEKYMKSYFKQREISENNEFLTSIALGYITEDALLGSMLGGNITGVVIGDLLNNNDELKQEFREFGGGDFGGSGASGSWDNINSESSNLDVLNTDNNLEPFS